MLGSLNALCISDLQIPADHKDALDFVQHVEKLFFAGVPHHIVNQGDEVDQHTMGKWAANPNGRSAGDEFKIAKEKLKPWFAAYPKTFVCVSNHTYRVYKRAFDIGIPDGFMKTIGEAYDAPPGWQWRDKWVAEGVCFEHGENVSGPNAARLAAIQNRMSTVIGHQHANGGVIYCAGFSDLIFGMNTGCLIDVTQYNFDYGKNLRNKPTLGCGVIRNGVPYFVPMLTDHQGNWLRRI